MTAEHERESIKLEESSRQKTRRSHASQTNCATVPPGYEPRLELDDHVYVCEPPPLPPLPPPTARRAVQRRDGLAGREPRPLESDALGGHELDLRMGGIIRWQHTRTQSASRQ